MEKVGIDDILNEEFEEVQTFAKAEKKAELAKLGEKFRSSGRPKKDESEKAKRRVIYYTDDEFSKIEKIAEIYSMTATTFIKFCVAKEIKKESL
jgi:hypothetical protein